MKPRSGYFSALFLLVFISLLDISVPESLEWGFLDLAMLVDKKDCDAEGFFEIRIEESGKTPWNKPAIYILHGLSPPPPNALYPRFSIEIGRTQGTLPDEMVPPFPRYQDSFTARINLASESAFSLGVSTWKLASSIDIFNCTTSMAAIHGGYGTITFSNKVAPPIEGAIPGVVIYPELVPGEVAKRLSKLVHTTFPSGDNFLLGDRSIRSICDSRRSILPDLEPFSSMKRQFILKNYYLERGSKTKTDSHFIFDNFTTSGSFKFKDNARILDSGREVCSKFAGNRKCLPFFLVGPEFSSEQQGQIRCRPENSNERHLEEFCYKSDPSYKPISQLSFKCTSISIDGNTISEVHDGSLVMRVYESNEPLKFRLRCRIPNDQRHALVLCPDDSESFCDPMLLIKEGKDLVLEASRISSVPGSNSPLNISLIGTKIADFVVNWGPERRDLRFFDIKFSLVSSRSPKIFAFFLSFSDQKLKQRYGESKIAQIEIIVKESNEIAFPSSDVASLFVEHFVDVSQGNFQLECGGSVIWQKLIGGYFFSKDELIEQFDTLNRAESVNAFIFGTSIEAGGSLKFGSISVAHGGFFRCSNDRGGSSLYHYQLVIVRKPIGCYAFASTDGKFQREIALPDALSPSTKHPFLAYGVTIVHERLTPKITIKCAVHCPSASTCAGSLICTQRRLRWFNLINIMEDLPPESFTPQDTCSATVVAGAENLAKFYWSWVKSQSHQTVAYVISNSSIDVKRIGTPSFLQQRFPAYRLYIRTIGKHQYLKLQRYGVGRFDGCSIVVSEQARFSDSEIVRLILPEFAPITVTYLCILGNRRDPVKFVNGSLIGTNISLTVRRLLANVQYSLNTSDDKNNFMSVDGYYDVSVLPTVDDWTIAIVFRFFPSVWKLTDPYQIAGKYSINFVHDNRWDGRERVFNDHIPQLWLQIVRLPSDSLERNCRRSVKGFEYGGNLNETVCGQKCLPWNVTAENNVTQVPDANNFCRNNFDRNSPNCQVEEGGGTSTKFCDVPFCTEGDILRRYFRHFRWCDECLKIGEYRKQATTLSLCAKDCDNEKSCSGFFFRTGDPPNALECQLTRQSCLSCTNLASTCFDSDIKFAYYEKRKAQLPKNNSDEDPKNVDSYWVHHYEDGALFIVLACKHFSDIETDENGLQPGATWDIYNPKTDEFETLPEERYHAYTEASTGFYLNFGSRRLEIRHSGLYRCKASDGKLEFHRLDVFAPMRCMIFVNRRFLKLTEGIYKFAFTAKTKFSQLFVNLICNIGERLVEFDDGGNFVNPALKTTVEADTFKASFHPYQKFIASEFGFNKFEGFEISFNFLPKPVPNTIQEVETVEVDSFSRGDIPIWLQFPNLASASLSVIPWSSTKSQFSLGQPTFEDRVIEIRLDPATKMTVNIEYKLLEPFPTFHTFGHRTFCSGGAVDRREACFPVAISVQSCGCNMSKLLPDFRKFSTCWNLLEISASFSSNSPVTSFVISLEFTGNLPSYDVKEYQKMAQIVADGLVIGVTVVEPLFNFHSNLNTKFVVKIPPTFFSGSKSFDCVLSGGSYAGIVSESGCLKRKCLHWNDTQFKATKNNWPSEKDENFCRVLPNNNFAEPVCVIGAENSRTPVFDVCDIPVCSDFSLGGYERLLSYELTRECSDKRLKEVYAFAKDFSFCQTKCDINTSCTGFTFQKNMCSLFFGACRGFNISVVCSAEKPVFYNKILAKNVEIERYQVLQVINFEWRSRTALSVFFPAGWSVKGNVDTLLTFFNRFGTLDKTDAWHNPATSRLHFQIPFEKSKYEGVYVLTHPSIPEHFAVVKINRPPECDLVLNGNTKSRANFDAHYRAKIDGSNVIRDAEFVCNETRFGLCGDNDGVTLCNPRIGIYFVENKRANFLYKSWHGPFSAQVNETCPDVTLEWFEEEGRLQIKLTANQKIADLRNLFLYFHFFPTTQPWPIEDIELLDEDNPDSVIRAISPDQVISQAFKNFPFTPFLILQTFILTFF